MAGERGIGQSTAAEGSMVQVVEESTAGHTAEVPKPVEHLAAGGRLVCCMAVAVGTAVRFVVGRTFAGHSVPGTEIAGAVAVAGFGLVDRNDPCWLEGLEVIGKLA